MEAIIRRKIRITHDKTYTSGLMEFYLWNGADHIIKMFKK